MISSITDDTGNRSSTPIKWENDTALSTPLRSVLEGRFTQPGHTLHLALYASATSFVNKGVVTSAEELEEEVLS